MKRIGLIALLHESNTFVNEPTTLGHFESNVLCEGRDVLNAFRGSHHEVGGFIDALEKSGDIEPAGVFAARAVPYGPISTECWRALKAKLMRALAAAGRLDGLLVAPHGATVATESLDADGDWLSSVREYVGTTLPIIGTLDLHANVSPRSANACDALLGYRTNPHLDQRARGVEAGRLMIRTLNGEMTPISALVQLPLCINIERQATAEPQGQRLRAAADQLLAGAPRLLGLSCFYGFPYADVDQMGASVIAVADRDVAQAQQAADQLARHWWAMRSEFVGELISVEEAIAMACRERARNPTRPVGLLDMGDNVGGGSAGDGTIIAHEWLRSGQGPILAILYDPPAVQQSEDIGVGGREQFAIGGKSDGLHGGPIEDHFTILRIGDGRFAETEPRHGGYSDFDQGRTAVLRSDSGVTIVATSRRVAPTSLAQLTAQHINPSTFAAIVIKGVHAPVAAYASVCSRLIRVDTPGSTCADLSQLPFRRRRRPMFPFEQVAVF
jgi:microcystin degradation protein MlrC